MSARTTESFKRTPGPHDYENTLLKTKSKSPKYTMSRMSKSLHQITIENNSYKPSPTAYHNNSGYNIKNKGGVVMCNAARFGSA